MPLYFFDTIIGGDVRRDQEGVELANLTVARQEALTTLYALASEFPPSIGCSTAGIQVRNRTGDLLIRVGIQTAVDTIEDFGGSFVCK